MSAVVYPYAMLARRDTAHPVLGSAPPSYTAWW